MRHVHIVLHWQSNQIQPQHASVCASGASGIMECVSSNEPVVDFGCIVNASLDSHSAPIVSQVALLGAGAGKLLCLYCVVLCRQIACRCI